MWGGHGSCVGRPWVLCGEAMGLMWGSHGTYVGRPWVLCREAMGLAWGGHGAYVGRPWVLSGEPMHGRGLSGRPFVWSYVCTSFLGQTAGNGDHKPPESFGRVWTAALNV